MSNTNNSKIKNEIDKYTVSDSKGLKKRVTYIDSAKGLGIIFVVLAHLLGVLVLTDPKPLMDPIWKYLCSVTIAFFFVASGMTMAITNETKKDFKILIKKKLSTIMYPYLTFSIIYLIYKIFAVYITHNKDYSVKDIVEGLIDAVTLRGSSVLWFLSALFLGSLFFNFVARKTKSISCFVLNLVLVLITVFVQNYLYSCNWYTDYYWYTIGDLVTTFFRIFTTSFFLNLGYLLYYFLNKYSFNKIIQIIIGFLFIAINFILAKYFIVDFAKNYFVGSLLSGNDIIKAGLDSFICLFIMIIGAIGLILIVKNLLDCKPLQYLGAKSIIIMVTHIDLKVLPYALSISYAIAARISHAKEYVLYFSMLFLIIVFEMIWIYLFSKPLKFLIKKDTKV